MQNVKVSLVNNSIIAALPNGELLFCNNATKELFYQVAEAQSIDEIKALLAPELSKEEQEVKKKEEEIKAIVDGFEILESTGEFEIKDNAVYMVGINRSIPELLVKEFIKAINTVCGSYYEEWGDVDHVTLHKDEYYKALKNFWLKCCCNPNAVAANDLFGFLQHHTFEIDKWGNFYAYRRVVSKESTFSEIVAFISNQYTKIKGWKKNPSNYHVMSLEGEYLLVKVEDILNKIDEGYTDEGNLKQLYLDLPDYQEKNYTSAHTGKEDYRVGEIIEMGRKDTDEDNTRSCSLGYHISSRDFDYSSFGDTPILAICNPMDVVAVPHSDQGKLRTCRWFFAAVLDDEEQYILDNEDFDVSEMGDIFEERMMINIEERIKESFVQEVARHSFNLPQITSKEIVNLTDKLKEIHNEIKSRVTIV